MKSTESLILKQSMIISFFGMIGCMLIGYLFLGSRIFIPRDPAFQFIVYGFIGSVMFSILRFSSLRSFLFVSVLFYLIEVTIIKFGKVDIFFARFLFFWGVVGSIFIFYKFFYLNLKVLKIGKFIILGGILALANMLIVSIGGQFVSVDNLKAIIEGQAFFGLLIGSGIGLGIEIAELFGNELSLN